MLNIDLTKRIAVVTGASGELGRQISRTLADCGADVVVCYHSAKERGEALASELRGRGVRSIAVQTDVTDEKSINSLRDRVQRELGDADIIVNDAVIQIHPWKSVMEQALSDYESQFRSCVMHNVLMARAFVPGMIDQGLGGRRPRGWSELLTGNHARQSAGK